MFHAITDGNGGLLYLKSIVRNYLALRHPGEMENVPSPNSASAGDMAQDSFRNFYEGTKRKKPAEKPKVYHPHGFLPYSQLQFFEGPSWKTGMSPPLSPTWAGSASRRV